MASIIEQRPAALTPTQRGLALLPVVEADIVRLFLSTIANPNTRAAYANDVAAYARWLHSTGVDDWTLLGATPYAAANWTRHMLETEGLSTSTVERRQSALSKLFRWGSVPGRFHAGRANPFDREQIDRTKGIPDHVDALTPAEVAGLLAAAEAGPHPDRDWLLVAIMATTGVRVSELCAATRGDLTVVRGSTELTVMGKGRKPRRVAVAAPIVERLGSGEPPAPLVPAPDGGHLNRGQVRNVLRRLARRAGLGEVTAHMLRATFVTEALEAGHELWAVQDAAGHADPRTTRDYQRRRKSTEARQAMALGLLAEFVEVDA